ncbi:MAG: hypothetical protein MZU91_06000 [Desulfosudis oleivorans]|nr:hypothetical protein [Desulfosudis oleivorans]
MELLGGNISAESDEGKGSTFKFNIPFKRDSEQIEIKAKKLNACLEKYKCSCG